MGKSYWSRVSKGLFFSIGNAMALGACQREKAPLVALLLNSFSDRLCTARSPCAIPCIAPRSSHLPPDPNFRQVPQEDQRGVRGSGRLSPGDPVHRACALRPELPPWALPRAACPGRHTGTPKAPPTAPEVQGARAVEISARTGHAVPERCRADAEHPGGRP